MSVATPLERAAHAVDGLTTGGPTRNVVAAALVAALDAEEMARVLYAEGAYCGDCEYEGWDTCGDCRAVVIGYAIALRRSILAGAP